MNVLARLLPAFLASALLADLLLRRPAP